MCARVNASWSAAAVSQQWQMKNAKWKMENDPVATARGSVTRSNTISAPKRPKARRKMPTELLIDFDEFWSRLDEDIRLAQQSIFVQTFALEGDRVGQKLSEALLSSPAQDKRILADS